MANSLLNLLYPCCAFLFFCLTRTATVVHDYNITWVTANPDGLFNRPTIGVNGQWPIPTINITKGDRLIVNVHNQLGNDSVSLHWHGIYLANQTYMDGVVGGTQCGIPSGSTGTYNFTVDQPGTYWYHSHVRGQYPDGLRAPLIVHDPESPFTGQYDEEVVLSVSDWYHEQMPNLIKTFISVANPTGAEPVPKSALMNDSQNVTFAMEAGKTYFFRIVNIGAFAGQYLWMEGHNMTIVEVDGIYTEPTEASMIYVTVAQRYGVLITARNDTSSNFAIIGSMDKAYFDTVPATLNPNVTGWLVYDKAAKLPTPVILDEFAPFDDFSLVPYDREKIYDNVSQTLVLNMVMDNLGDGANYAFINDETYVGPKVPTLYSVLTTGANATDASVYGVNTNPFVLKYNEVIEIVLNNLDPGKHPWHLHGHDFQVVARSKDGAGLYSYNDTLVETPMRRDTLLVEGGGYFVIRFRSDNPGVWLFHCHIEWHVDSGLIATMVEAPLEMQQLITIPEDQYELCRAQGIPVAGNAAGNTKNFDDLTGNNVSPAPLPAGFTARGIVALVFSCISAFLGLAAITWYGMAPLGSAELQSAKKVVLEAGIEPPK